MGTPGSWAAHSEVAASTVGVGFGYVLAEGDGVVCVDLDHCLSGGELESWARAILDRCPATFIEISPGGDGLHVWGRGELKRGRRMRNDGAAVEVYGQGRYVAVTGHRFENSPLVLADLSEVVASLV